GGGQRSRARGRGSGGTHLSVGAPASTSPVSRRSGLSALQRRSGRGRDVRGVDPCPVQQLLGGAGAGHAVDGEVPQVQIGDRFGGQRGQDGGPQASLGVV